jgi:hypothetical protein
LAIAFGTLWACLRRGRCPDPRNRLKECTPMIHDGISVPQLQEPKKNDTIGHAL